MSSHEPTPSHPPSSQNPNRSSKYEFSDIAKAALIASNHGALGSAPGAVSGGPALNVPKSKESRYSVAALWSMAAENDIEVDDELTKLQQRLRELKLKISTHSKRNFVLEKDVRYLDSRIALLIQNRMGISEEMTAHLDEVETTEGTLPDDRKRQHYANLFYLLQSEPRHVAGLARIVSLADIDMLLQTVMFTLYGNQYDTREEYLLLSMFQNVLAAEFENATEFANLMRANTPVSRMMTTYTRRGPGQSYLKSVLADRVNKLIELRDLDLEINPLKVYEQMIRDIEESSGKPSDLPRGVTPDVAAANRDVQAIIAPRLKTLMEIGSSFLGTIMGSLDQVPYGIRWICKQIRSLTKRKYSDATDSQICSLIGGFFMLRFVNPAIVTPQAYMLVDGVPSKNPRRTLTLIAKLLQNLANKPSYAKEPYMMALNPFVEHNKPRFNSFLNDLCEVTDFSEALELEQYVALSKKEIQLNITLSELYGMHGLALQHIDAICPQTDGHLRVILNDLGTSQTVSRRDNKTITLQLFSRWDQTNIGDFTSAAGDQLTQGDFMYMDAKAIFVQIIRTVPQLAEQRPLSLSKVAEFAATSKEPSLVRKGLKVRDMLQELEHANLVDAKDGHQIMAQEILQEIAHLGNLKEKVEKEIISLETVYKTIQDHNDYLRSQLESYKAYLQNVRSQSGMPAQKSAAKPAGPFKFSHQKLEQEGIIEQTTIPENRQSNVYFSIASPSPGSYLISLNYKGREKPILEMDLKLDDLLEKQQLGVQVLDLEYVKLNVPKTLALLNKCFLKK